MAHTSEATARQSAKPDELRSSPGRGAQPHPRRRACACLLGLWLLGWAGVAHANPHLARAHRLADAARFEAALRALARAEASRLNRAELVRLFTRRAMVHFALADRDAMRADLRLLAALEPHMVLPSTTPPAVRGAFEASRNRAPQRLHADARAERTGASVRIQVDVRGAPPGLLRTIRVGVRRAPASAYAFHEGGEVTLPWPADAPASYYVALLGPGGALLSTVGTPRAPRPIPVTAPPAALAGDGRPPDADPADDGGDDAWAWGLGIGGAALVAGAAVAVALLLTQTSQGEETAISGPQIRD